MGQVIFINHLYHPGWEQLQINQAMQDQINSERARIRNWSLDKSPYEIAAAYIAWHKKFRSKIEIVKSDQSNFNIAN